MSRLALALWVAAALAFKAPAFAVPEDDAVATGLAREALGKYTVGRYLEAAELFYRAFELSHRPGPLWNAAKALAMAGERVRATELFHLYRSQPSISDAERAEAEEELGRLERPPAVITSSSAAAPSPRASIEVPAPLPEPPDRLMGAVTLVAGSAAVAIGSGMLVDTYSRQAALEARLGQTMGGLIVGVPRDEALAQRNGIVAERVVASGLIGAGAIAAAIVLGLWMFED